MGNATYGDVLTVGSGYTQGTGSIRAPIFYDSNNTGYYLDPASTSNILALSISSGQKITLQDANHFLRYQATGFSGVTIDGPQLAGHQGGELATNNGGDNWSLRWNQSGDIFSRASSRSPIFYDRDNTAYYADFASTGDSIRAAGNITAYYSDMRLKKYLGKIENAVDKVKQLEGFYYEANEIAQKLGYKPKREVGVSAQSVQEVLPEIVADAPINSNYLTIDYERLTPLLIEAIKEQQTQIEDQKSEISELKSMINMLVDKVNKLVD